MKTKNKGLSDLDKVQLILAYFGNFFITAWFLWSYEKYGVVGCCFYEFCFKFLKVLIIA